MDFLKEIEKLRKKNVHINFTHDIYDNGNNCNFSIIFSDIDKQTGTFGDNHEFGETEDVMKKAVDTANYFLSHPEYLDYYFFKYKKGDSEEEHKKKLLKHMEVREKIHKFIQG